ncbi:Rieske (2Fe-2S) protein [Natranaeroarchaeum aerophilus]|uniref:Rieske (2Fe-2S) protein n=1 Tax=Natranaeroarchaeum aerophilus TaxID=2917711 RepID=A0AAE3FPH3_9EURY|nr:Rieske (2Fe-2S) protein [Natranaeroarchaeum aerophilus]MCL9812776.1 Rieske (2Fe-2S) protein [Natranaeroarchaeum aerophilus]
MSGRYRLTSVETVRDEGSWLFRVRDAHGAREEVILVPCEESGVEAWRNRCTHENQRLHREGVGAAVRESGIVCPKHGSIFDTCSGACDNGEAADTTLPSVDVTVENGQVYLTDDDVDYLGTGGIDDDEEDGPSSSSHLQF